jgi:transcriptional regulator of acetoin/glycerol metabolism
VSSDTTGEITLAVSESISEDKETSNSYLREVVATQVKKIEDNIEKEVLEKSYSHALASKEDIDSVMQNIEEEMQTPVAQRLETIKEKMALYQIDSLSNDSESNIDYSNNDYTYSVESEKLYSEAAVRKEQLINSLEVVEKKIESIQESLSNEDNTFADNTRYKYELKTLSNKKLIYQKKYNSINNSISYGSY